jgi:hypothetical protein
MNKPVLVTAFVELHGLLEDFNWRQSSSGGDSDDSEKNDLRLNETSTLTFSKVIYSVLTRPVR